MFQRRKPIFQRVSKLVKLSILTRLKLPRKPGRSARRGKLLQQDNYKFFQEYQFSPSSTSLIRHNRKRSHVSRSGLRRIYGLLCLSRCHGRHYEDRAVDTITQSWMGMEPLHCVLGVASPSTELPQSLDYYSGDDSIDLKAEKFINKFYDEMRRQAREFS